MINFVEFLFLLWRCYCSGISSDEGFNTQYSRSPLCFQSCSVGGGGNDSDETLLALLQCGGRVVVQGFY